jgi:hypothetical protein
MLPPQEHYGLSTFNETGALMFDSRMKQFIIRDVVPIYVSGRHNSLYGAPYSCGFGELMEIPFKHKYCITKPYYIISNLMAGYWRSTNSCGAGDGWGNYQSATQNGASAFLGIKNEGNDAARLVWLFNGFSTGEYGGTGYTDTYWGLGMKYVIVGELST